MPGELAKQNATRNTRRTSATAAALMIGLTLVVSMGVFASSLKASFGDVLSDQTNADLYIATSSTQAPGFSPEVVKAVQGVEGVDEVSANGWGQARFNKVDGSFSSVDPTNAEEVMNLKVSEGSIADLGKNGVVVGKSAATVNGWEMGDKIVAEFAASGKHKLNIVGIYEGKGWIGDDFILSLDQQNAFAGPQLVSTGLVTLAAGADKAEVAGRHHGGPGRPPGRPGPGPEGLREGGHRLHRPAARLHDGDAPAGRRDRPAGHRQHAGAVGLRAHP